MHKLIPLYTAAGELGDWISEQRMERLDKLGLIQIIRHKKGRVSRCLIRQRPGDPEPMKPADYLGTRYSFREHLDSGRITWSLKRLGHGDELRPIFMRVVTDCLATP